MADSRDRAARAGSIALALRLGASNREPGRAVIPNEPTYAQNVVALHGAANAEQMLPHVAGADVLAIRGALTVETSDEQTVLFEYGHVLGRDAATPDDKAALASEATPLPPRLALVAARSSSLGLVPVAADPW